MASTRELEERRAQQLEAQGQAEAARSALEDAKRVHAQQLADEQADHAALADAARMGVATLIIVLLAMARELDEARARLAAAEKTAQDGSMGMVALVQENAELIHRLKESTEFMATRLGELETKTRAMDELDAAFKTEFDALRRRAAELEAENAVLSKQVAEARHRAEPPSPSAPSVLATAAPPRHPSDDTSALAPVDQEDGDADEPADEGAAPVELATATTAGRKAQAQEKRRRRRRR